jgi:hypothetical protein
MINQVGLTPEPELIEKTFGKGWSFQKEETILDQFGTEDSQEQDTTEQTTNEEGSAVDTENVETNADAPA